MTQLKAADDAARGTEPALQPGIFTTLKDSEKHQFSRWRCLVSPILDVTTTKSEDDGFSAKTRAYDLGQMSFVNMSVDPMTYSHTRDHLKSSAFDHWCLSYLKSGFETIRFEKQTLQMRAGDLYLVSFAQPFRGQSGFTDAIRIFLSRDDFSSIADLLDGASFTRLDGSSLSYILREYILSIDAALTEMQLSNLPLVSESFVHLLTATLGPIAGAPVPAGLTPDKRHLDSARQFIQANLAYPDLGPDMISRAVGISRRQLYYLFERYGGVKQYVRKRRLLACLDALSDPSDHRLISSIAYSNGYIDAALFSRQFLAEFGVNPTDARANKLTRHGLTGRSPKTFCEWFS